MSPHVHMIGDFYYTFDFIYVFSSCWRFVYSKYGNFVAQVSLVFVRILDCVNKLEINQMVKFLCVFQTISFWVLSCVSSRQLPFFQYPSRRFVYVLCIAFKGYVRYDV